MLMSGFNKRTVVSIALLILPVKLSWTVADRTPVYARSGMVVTASMIASEIGRDVLKRGGNAVDAAVATAFALAVTWPIAGNIGGGGFLVFMNSEGQVTTFDFREKAPLAATRDMFVNQNGQIRNNSNHDGLLAVGVPGTVAGLFRAHQKYGTQAWFNLVDPAVKLARDGFPLPWSVYHHLDQFLERRLEEYSSTATKMLKKNGSRYQPGELWTQPDLAETLTRIRDQGEEGFYKGKTAQILSAFMSANGGIISERDLLAYDAVEREPVIGSYRGFEVYSMPPPSSGGVALLEILNVLEGYNLDSLGHNSARYIHILAETMRRAFADRAEFMGDPDFNPNAPVARLISKEYGQMVRNQINPDTASKSDIGTFSDWVEGENTTHFSIYDTYGNAVSMTFTLEYPYGTGIVAEGLGFFLNNEMGDFNPIPGLTNKEGLIGTGPNLIEPGKRMLSSMTPTILAKDGKPFLIIGSPGGRTIINTVLQVSVNVLDHGMNIAQAIDAGRIHHQWFPDQILYEQWSISPDTKYLLESMGHRMVAQNRSQGRAMGIYIDLVNGLISGAADSRSPDGGAAGY